MKIAKLVFNIVMPSIMTSGLIVVYDTFEDFKYSQFYLSITTFGVIIVLFNLKKLKRNILFTLFISIASCFAVFFMSLFVGSLLYYVIEEAWLFFFQKLDIPTEITPLISTAIVSPILMFCAFWVIFKIKKDRYLRMIQILTVLSLLVVLSIIPFTRYNFEVSLFICWQFIMALSLQLILYRNELIKTFQE